MIFMQRVHCHRMTFQRRMEFHLSTDLKRFLADVSLDLDDKIDSSLEENKKNELKEKKKEVREKIKSAIEIIEKYTDAEIKSDWF